MTRMPSADIFICLIAIAPPILQSKSSVHLGGHVVGYFHYHYWSLELYSQATLGITYFACKTFNAPCDKLLVGNLDLSRVIGIAFITYSLTLSCLMPTSYYVEQE
ncbi:uncharacterized protein EI90DRAFT_3038779 [Cantharellus anzutake]|uniref:uncharacterized protein n=1 Tax=Cantharellus anzutake TaxID=1750568 RepID=UPI0019071A17|nr:uncharacterized protein EI90DRAFT_3038779 [Cantharellus anzutake]KAF8340006.1 hypothetical protein EI90DRAFT_3038779 [Cantharellus anzutake]